jgi:formamidopyrimidine-DNA glycosylase
VPELPEVETVRRLMQRVLVGQRIARVEVVRDPLVFSGLAPRVIEAALVGRTVCEVGRRGKSFWLVLDGDGPVVFGHLGMSGWVRELGADGTRLHSQGDASFDDPSGRPRFLRLAIHTAAGKAVAFTDGRRLGRIWLGKDPDPLRERRIKRLGPDAFEALPRLDELCEKLRARKPAIKAVLLDQTVLAGIGNWIADEVLYQSRIAPARPASSLTRAEVAALRRAIASVLRHAVRVSADHRRFPSTWLFEHRWGGRHGSTRVGGRPIERTTIGGRTTAWVPSRQR